MEKQKGLKGETDGKMKTTAAKRMRERESTRDRQKSNDFSFR